MKPSIIIMGVSGCGKTTVGQLLATRLELPFFDADDFHSPQNKQKMASGIALTDADRADWLEALATLLETRASPCVLACSALKEKYRQTLARGAALRFVYLKGSRELIAARLAAREHFFSPSLLESQFAALEEPVGAIVQSIELPIEIIVENLMQSDLLY